MLQDVAHIDAEMLLLSEVLSMSVFKGMSLVSDWHHLIHQSYYTV